MMNSRPASPWSRRSPQRRSRLSAKDVGHTVRDLTEHEQVIVRLCQEKYGVHERDELFFLDSGDAILQVWGTDGGGPWVHLSNLGRWLAEGALTEGQIKDTQV